MVEVEKLGLNFEKGNGLIMAIVQDCKSNEILTSAFMNKEALQKTLDTRKTHFWSRSKQGIRMKGEQSGYIQKVKGIHMDCDGDAILIKVEQVGSACHEGYRSCFFRKLKDGEFKIVERKVFDPKKVYGENK